MPAIVNAGLRRRFCGRGLDGWRLAGTVRLWGILRAELTVCQWIDLQANTCDYING